MLAEVLRVELGTEPEKISARFESGGSRDVLREWAVRLGRHLAAVLVRDLVVEIRVGDRVTPFHAVIVDDSGKLPSPALLLALPLIVMVEPLSDAKRLVELQKVCFDIHRELLRKHRKLDGHRNCHACSDSKHES